MVLKMYSALIRAKTEWTLETHYIKEVRHKGTQHVLLRVRDGGEMGSETLSMVMKFWK